jgi:hypothetical protein
MAEYGGEVFLGRVRFSAMKLFIAIAIVVLVISLWAVVRSRSRSQILHGSRSKFGIAPTSKPTEPWGVSMDINHGGMTLTVVAASYGSASLYFSNGGGYLGGKTEEPIRRVAQRALEVAGNAESNARDPDLPTTPRGRSHFLSPHRLGGLHGEFFARRLKFNQSPTKKAGRCDAGCDQSVRPLGAGCSTSSERKAVQLSG